jgi:type II secretory pathway component PulF
VLAWGAAGGGGLFAAVLRDLSAGLSTNALEFDRFVDRLAAGLPGDNLALDEFLQMVKLHKRGTSITNQLEALAQTMRAELKDRIEELGGAAERRVIILGSGFVLLISVLLSMGLPLLSFFGV